MLFNYKDENYNITNYLERISPPKEETNALQEPMEEEIVVIESPLDEKEEESDEQKEEEWSSYPCLPPNESNSLTLILYDCPPCLPKEDDCYIDECYDPMDSFEISLFDEVDAFYTCGHDATMDDACEDELAIVPYVKHEIVDIAPYLIVLLSF